MNTNTRFDAIKKADGTTTIRMKFSAYDNAGNYDDELLMPIDVKPITPTAAEVKKYGGTKEFCRCDITKWEVVGAPKISLKYVSHLVGKTIWAYFNGYECAWKPQDPDGGIDAKNATLNRITGKFTEVFIDRLDVYLEDNADDFYAPHNDELGIYGNPNAHAVYNMKANTKACATKKDKMVKFHQLRYEMPESFDWCDTVFNVSLRAHNFLRDARKAHSKIPFADFGKALRLVVNYEKDDVKLGKSLVEVIDDYLAMIEMAKSK